MLLKWPDRERVIHSIKTAIACVIGILLSRLIGLPADQWVVITIIVVMCAQLYVGSVVQKAYLRFLGTLIGCLFAMTVIVSVGSSDLAIILAIGASSLIFSYFATGLENLSYTGTLGAVTTAIIMLGQTPTITFAAERFLEISIGLMIAALVSQFVLPIHARTHLRRAQAATLQQLSDLYTTLMIKPSTELKLDYNELDENIVKSLLRQRQLAKESVREPLGAAFNSKHFMHSLFCEREMLRAMMFMRQALIHIQEDDVGFFLLPGLQQFNKMVLTALAELKTVIEHPQMTTIEIRLPILTRLKADIDQRRHELSVKTLIDIDGFIFSADILSRSLGKLAKLNHVVTDEVAT